MAEKPIHPAINDKKLKALEETLLKLHQKSAQSGLRQRLLDNIKGNRRMYWDKDLGVIDFPFENASNKNIPTLATQIDSIKDKTVNPTIKAIRTLDFEMSGEGQFPADKRKEYQEKLDEEIKSGRLNISHIIDKFYETVLLDGIFGIRVVSEFQIQNKKESLVMAEWIRKPEFAAEYYPQIKEVYQLQSESDLINIPPTQQIELSVRVVNKYPTMKIVRLDDLFWNDDGESYKYLDYLTYRKNMCLNEVYVNALGGGIYDLDAYNKLKEDIKTEQYKTIQIKTQEGNTQSVYIDNMISRQSVQIGESYMRYDIDNNGVDELCIVEFASIKPIEETDKIYILRVNAFLKSYPPIVLGYLKSQSNLLIEAQSEADAIYSLHGIINKLFNDVMDANTYQNSLIKKVKTGKGYSSDDLITAPGADWPVEDMGDVEIVNMPEVKPSMFQMQQYANAYIQKRTMITDVSMASGGKITANDTARGISMIMAEANNRIGRYLQTLTPYVSDAIQIYFENLTGESNYRVIINLDIFNITKELAVGLAEKLSQSLLQIQEFRQIPGSARKAINMVFEAVGREGFDELWPEDPNDAKVLQLAQVLTQNPALLQEAAQTLQKKMIVQQQMQQIMAERQKQGGMPNASSNQEQNRPENIPPVAR